MKKSIFELISIFIEKHLKKGVLILVVATILIPFIVWLLYALPPIIHTDISADGILAYLGVVLSGSVSLLVACIALYQSNKIVELQKEVDLENRLDKILPRLQINIEHKNDYYTISVINYGEFPAIQIYLYEYLLFQTVEINKKKSKHFSFNSENKSILNVDEFYFNINDRSQIMGLEIYYYDVDGNFIAQEFTLNDDGGYNGEKPYYVIRKDIE